MEEVRIDLFSFWYLRYTSVSVVTRLRVGQPRNHCSMPSRVKVLLLCSARRQYRIRRPPSFTLIGNLGNVPQS